MRFPITRHFLKGWRTRIIAGAVFLLGLLEAVDPYTLAGMFGHERYGFVILAISLLMFFLREVTDSPPGSEGNTETWFHSEDGTEV